MSCACVAFFVRRATSALTTSSTCLRCFCALPCFWLLAFSVPPTPPRRGAKSASKNAALLTSRLPRINRVAIPCGEDPRELARTPDLGASRNDEEMAQQLLRKFLLCTVAHAVLPGEDARELEATHAARCWDVLPISRPPRPRP